MLLMCGSLLIVDLALTASEHVEEPWLLLLLYGRCVKVCSLEGTFYLFRCKAQCLAKRLSQRKNRNADPSHPTKIYYLRQISMPASHFSDTRRYAHFSKSGRERSHSNE